MRYAHRAASASCALRRRCGSRSELLVLLATQGWKGNPEEAVIAIDSWRPFRDGGHDDGLDVDLNSLGAPTKDTIYAAVLGADLAA